MRDLILGLIIGVNFMVIVVHTIVAVYEDDIEECEKKVLINEKN